MSDKSPQKASKKKATKSLKEKQAAKRDKKTGRTSLVG